MDVCRQLCDVCVNVCRKPDGPHDVKFLIYEHTPAYYAQQSPIAISRLTGKLRVSITCCSTRRNSKVVSPFFFIYYYFPFSCKLFLYSKLLFRVFFFFCYGSEYPVALLLCCYPIPLNWCRFAFFLRLIAP